MQLEDLDFELPPELIAQRPAAERDASRMLHVDRAAGSFSDRVFADIPRLLRRGDLLVVNNTRVFPARLQGRSETGAAVEFFLIEEMGDGIWRSLARPARRIRPGKMVFFGAGLKAEVLEKNADGSLLARYETEGDFYDLVQRIGETPLPPYISREQGPDEADRERYQTVFARERGAVAAPTAGLHFTPEVLAQLKEAGIGSAEITLHVGYGTFEPVRVDDLSLHSVLPERFSITEEAADAIESARRGGRRIVAVGTTTTRTLESRMNEEGRISAGTGMASLTIRPGHRFRAVGALLTNFHLPKSSLLMLVSAFGGHELIMRAYAHAVAQRYRFYSYGDCMLIV